MKAEVKAELTLLASELTVCLCYGDDLEDETREALIKIIREDMMNELMITRERILKALELEEAS